MPRLISSGIYNDQRYNEQIKKIKNNPMNYIKNNLKNIIIATVVLAILGFQIMAKADESKLLNLESKLFKYSDSIQSLDINLNALKAQKKGVLNDQCITIKELATLKLAMHFSGDRALQDGESESELLNKSKQSCETNFVEMEATNIDLNNIKPENLFYTFLTTDEATVSQSPKEHFKNNGYMATDIATSGRKLTTYAPSLLKDGGDHVREYTVKLADNVGTMGETIELHWKEEGAEYSWSIGHMYERHVKDGDVVKTGDVIGMSGGCPGELKLEEVSTGCHVHIELRINGQAVEYPFDNNSKHTETGRLSFGAPKAWTEGLV